MGGGGGAVVEEGLAGLVRDVGAAAGGQQGAHARHALVVDSEGQRRVLLLRVDATEGSTAADSGLRVRNRNVPKKNRLKHGVAWIDPFRRPACARCPWR